MERFARSLVAVAAVALCAPTARAQEEEGAFASYLGDFVLQGWIGAQSMLTAPLDPVAETVWPPEEFAEIAGAPVTSHLVGAGTGLLLGSYRLVMGFTDLVLSPLPMVPVSPPLRFSLSPGLVQEREGDPEWICDLDGWGEAPRSWPYRLGVVWCFPWSKGSAGEASDEG